MDVSPYRSPFVRAGERITLEAGRMPETVLLVLALTIAAGIVAILVLLLRSRAPQADPAAEQRITELNARVQAMGDLLAKAQSQLQHTVNERLDAVSARLGESMQTSTKHTTEYLPASCAAGGDRQRAKEHHRSRHPG